MPYCHLIRPDPFSRILLDNGSCLPHSAHSLQIRLLFLAFPQIHGELSLNSFHSCLQKGDNSDSGRLLSQSTLDTVALFKDLGANVSVLAAAGFLYTFVVHNRPETASSQAQRLLLETRYRRLPVVGVDGKLVGLITRGDIVRAALQIKRAAANN